MSEEDKNMFYGLSILVVICCIVGFFSGSVDLSFKIIGALASAAALVYIIETTWKRAFKKANKVEKDDDNIS
jgi:hypothetical protein